MKNDLIKKLPTSFGVRTKSALVLAALLSIGSALAWGQDEQSSSKPLSTKEAQVKTNSADQASAKKTTKKNTGNTKAATKKPKVFIPSEEISEDLPVSFPVDI